MTILIPSSSKGFPNSFSLLSPIKIILFRNVLCACHEIYIPFFQFISFNISEFIPTISHHNYEGPQRNKNVCTAAFLAAESAPCWVQHTTPPHQKSPHLPPQGLRTLGGKSSAGPRALRIQRGRACLQLTQLDQAVHLTKAAAGVVSALGLQVRGFGVQVLHRHLSAIHATARLPASILDNKAIECIHLLFAGAKGQVGRLEGVAPVAPVLGGLVEAGPAGGLAEGVQVLHGKEGREEKGGREGGRGGTRMTG